VHAFEKTPPDVQEILSKPIRNLGLKLEGSPLEAFVQKLYRELDRKGLQKFHPKCYLTDEWGCPDGEPVIGIPFYLADPSLAKLEKEINDLEDAREIMMYLRHEAGHAFNYAYELYKTAEWRQVFGPFRRAYREKYRPVPFSRSYVRHIAGWYAQKHPDEDFAETFAVWLTPGSRWRKRYSGWGALAKLKYVDRVVRKLASSDPVRQRGETDITVQEMDATVAEFYRRSATEEFSVANLVLDPDLLDIFNISKRRRRGVRAAADMLHQHRKPLVSKITYWTGAHTDLIRNLVELIETRVRELDLRADITRESEHLTELTVYATALAMNYVANGKFVQP
jgi:hypothetical protein